jgi:hypothetical protein
MRTLPMMSGPGPLRAVARSQMGLRQASTSALDAPPPGSGEVRHTALPDTFDGIRFEIGRMTKYVASARNDPWLADFASWICSNYARMAGSLAALEGKAPGDQRTIACEALDRWCRDHFAYVNDPPNIEVIQTPRRMVKQTLIPSAVVKSILEPFYEEFAQAEPSFYVEGYVPPPLYFGDCDEAVVAFLGLCVALPAGGPGMNGAGEEPIRACFRFGGNDGTLHHVWARVYVGATEIDADHTEPGYKIGDFSRFEAYEEVEVPA